MNNTGLREGTYWVSAACGNCGYVGKITASKGTKIAGPYVCPKCGCTTLVKKWE